MTSRHEAAKEALDIIHEISILLNTQLDRTALSYCVSMIENGANPEALATVVKELRREGEALKQDQGAGEQGTEGGN